MTQALKDAKLRIHYEPRCLIGSYGRCGWGELLEWSTRQMILTKVYSRKLWQLALVSQWTFSLVWWWALAGVVVAFLAEGGRLVGFGRLERRHPEVRTSWQGFLFLFGAVRGWYRTRTIQHMRPERRDEIQNFWWGYVLLFPLASTLTAYNLARSALTSSIEWRGVRYEFGSAQELRVIRSE